MNEVSAFVTETPDGSVASSSSTWGLREKPASWEPGSRPPPEFESASALIGDFSLQDCEK